MRDHQPEPQPAVEHLIATAYEHARVGDVRIARRASARAVHSPGLRRTLAMIERLTARA